MGRDKGEMRVSPLFIRS